MDEEEKERRKEMKRRGYRHIDFNRTERTTNEGYFVNYLMGWDNLVIPDADSMLFIDLNALFNSAIIKKFYEAVKNMHS